MRVRLFAPLPAKITSSAQSLVVVARVHSIEQRRREFKRKCLRGLLLILNLRLVRSSRDELLAAVDVVRRARECCVAHDVNGWGGDVSRSDDAADRQRRPELVAPLVEVFAED